MSEPEYSQDIIRRYREMDDANAFRHEAKRRVPIGLDYDRAILSCGHEQEMLRHFLKATDGKLQCEACKQEWLAKAIEEEKRTKS
jgi:hypothetical protein